MGGRERNRQGIGNLLILPDHSLADHAGRFAAAGVSVERSIIMIELRETGIPIFGIKGNAAQVNRVRS